MNVTPGTAPIKKFVAPTPANPKVEKPKYDEAAPKVVVEAPVKRPFVRKPHLTDRPLRNNEELRELQKKLTSQLQRNNRNARINVKNK